MKDVTVQLSKPILVENEEIAELTLREPTVKDLLAQDKVAGDMARMVLMVGQLANLPKSSVEQLTAKDFTRTASKVADFLDDGPATGVI